LSKILLSNQRGESPLALPVIMLITVMVLYMGVDFLGIYSAHQKLRTAASETLTLMKMENGWDNDTHAFFNTVLLKTGLQPGEVTIDFCTPKQQAPPVQRGEPVTLEVSTMYHVRSLKPLDQNITVPVRVRLTGLAQEFVR